MAEAEAAVRAGEEPPKARETSAVGSFRHWAKVVIAAVLAVVAVAEVVATEAKASPWEPGVVDQGGVKSEGWRPRWPARVTSAWVWADVGVDGPVLAEWWRL